MNDYKTWENFRVVKKFPIIPLRLYQWSSHRLWWFWLETSYILQHKHQGPPEYGILTSISKWFSWQINGYYWDNSRKSYKKEYEDYLKHKPNLIKVDGKLKYKP